MKNGVFVLSIFSVLGLFVFTSTGVACGMGYGHGGSNSQSSLTADQKQQLEAVNDKYFQPLEEVQVSLNEKTREYQEARSNENTTVGTLNRLEAEIADLERQYGKVLDKANTEADKFMPDDYGPGFNCAYSGCSHQYHRGDDSHRDHMGQGYRRGMGDRHMNSCWRW